MYIQYLPSAARRRTVLLVAPTVLYTGSTRGTQGMIRLVSKVLYVVLRAALPEHFWWRSLFTSTPKAESTIRRQGNRLWRRAGQSRTDQPQDQHSSLAGMADGARGNAVRPKAK